MKLGRSHFCLTFKAILNKMEKTGIIRATLRLVNTADEIKLEEGMIVENAVREVEDSFLVDTGAYMLSINETMRHRLGLGILATKVMNWQTVLNKNLKWSDLYRYISPTEILCAGHLYYPEIQRHCKVLFQWRIWT